MILTQSTAARIGASVVNAIASATESFLHFMCYSTTTINKVISGNTGLIKNGQGTLLIPNTGGADYTGPTIINAGQINFSGTSTLNGIISGSGILNKGGTGTLTLGASNTYSGGTTMLVSSTLATITYSSNNAFGTGLFTSSSTCQIVATDSVTLSNNFQIGTGVLQYRTSTGGVIITLTGNLSGTGGINKTGNGRLYLNGNLTYTGATQITAGYLRASKTVNANGVISTATATFAVLPERSLSVSFNVSPASGATTNYRFFQGSTSQSFTSITLSGVPAGTTATYNSSTSTLSVTVP